MKCTSCRKQNIELTTWWERLKYKLMMRWFGEEVVDFGQDRNVQGFGDGYKIGWQHALNQVSKRYEDEVKEFLEEKNKAAQKLPSGSESW